MATATTTVPSKAAQPADSPPVSSAVGTMDIDVVGQLGQPYDFANEETGEQMRDVKASIQGGVISVNGIDERVFPYLKKGQLVRVKASLIQESGRNSWKVSGAEIVELVRDSHEVAVDSTEETLASFKKSV